MTAQTLPNKRTPDKQKPLYSISEAAKLLRVSPKTLRRWEKRGLITSFRTNGNQRRYSLEELNRVKEPARHRKLKALRARGHPTPETPEKGFLSIGEAAKQLGVSTKTLRRWDKQGILSPIRTAGGQRRYTQESLDHIKERPAPPPRVGPSKVDLRRKPTSAKATAGRPPRRVRVWTLEEARAPFRPRYTLRKLAVVALALIIAAQLWFALPPLTKKRLERAFSPSPINPIVDVNDIFEYKIGKAGNWRIWAKYLLEADNLVAKTFNLLETGVFNTVQLVDTIFFGEGKRYFINRLGDATLRAATFFERVAIKTGITAGTALKISFEKATQTGDLTGVEVDFSKITDPPSTLTRYGVHLKDSSEPTATDYGVYVEGTNWDYGIYSEDDLYIGGTLTVGDETTISGNILPGIDSTFDIGAINIEWANLYVDDITAGTIISGDTTLSSLTVTDQTDLQGNVLDTTGNLTLNDTIDISEALNVTGATTLSDTLTVAGATTLSSTLDVVGATTLSSTLDVSGNTTVGGDLSVTGSVSGGATDLSSLIVTGTSDLRGDVLDTTGNLTLNDTVDINGDLTVSEQLALNGAAINNSYIINTLVADTQAGLNQTITAGDSWETYGVRNIFDLNVDWAGGYSVYSEFTDSAGATDGYGYGAENVATLSGDGAAFYGVENRVTLTGANAIFSGVYNYVATATGAGTRLYGSDSNLTVKGTDSTVYGGKSIITLGSTATSSIGYGFYTEVRSSVASGTSWIYGLRNKIYPSADNTVAYGVHTAIGLLGDNATAYGTYTQLDQSTGTQTLYGNYVRLTAGAGDTAYGNYVIDYTTSGGTQYGYYVNLSDPDSTNWSFYGVDGGGNAYFGDDVSVGDDLTAGGTISGTDFSCTNCLDFAEFEDTLDLDAALTLNQGTNTWTQNFTDTTTTGFTYNANSLTSGKALNISSSATAFTGDLIDVTLSGSNAANTGSLLSLTNSGTSNTNTAFYIKHYATGTNNLAMRVDDVSGDTTPFVIDGAGNVGIGTAGPAAKLDLGASATNKIYLTSGAADYYSGLGADMDIGNYETNLFFNEHVNAKLNIGQWNGTTYDSKMVILANGYVGIGTPTPSVMLNLYSGSTNVYTAIDAPVANEAGIEFRSAGNPKWYFRRLATTEDLSITEGITEHLTLYQGGTSYFGGDVGIGTATPGASNPPGWNAADSKLLEITGIGGAGDAGLFLRRGNYAPLGLDVWQDSDTGAAYIDVRYNGASAALHLRMQTAFAAIDAVTIAYTGHVGVNKAVPGFGVGGVGERTLTVEGTGATVWGRGMLFLSTAKDPIVAGDYIGELAFMAPALGAYVTTGGIIADIYAIATVGGAASGGTLVLGTRVDGTTGITGKMWIDNIGNTYPGANKTQDLGLSGAAWDDAWADDYNNEPDLYWLDVKDDLAVIRGIRPSDKIDPRTGFTIIDDDSIPDWVWTKDKVTGEIVYDPDGKPWLSAKMFQSLTWGAIRQLVERIEQIETGGTDHPLNLLLSVESVSLVDDEGDLADEEGKIIAGTVEAEEGIFGKLTVMIGEFISIIANSIKTAVLEVTDTLTAKLIRTERLEADEILLDGKALADTSTGEAVIKAGETVVLIEDPEVTPESKIFLTPLDPTGGQPLFISQKATGKFEVSIDTPLEHEIRFDYWIVN